MENKAKDMCPRCKYCLGMTPQGMYYCGYADDGSELNIGIDVNMSCANFEEKSYTECPLYKKMTEGRYPWGSDEDKILKYCANDVSIIAEQMAREKQKELEAKADKYEDILVDICDALDPHFDFDKYDDVIEVFENLPSRILDFKRSWKDNFDECIRKMDIIDELKAENSKLKEEIEKLRLTLGEKTEDLHELSNNYDELLDKHDKLKCKLLDILQKKEELEARVTELIKASKRKDELIQDYREKLKKADDEINLLNSKFDKLGEYYRTDENLINNIQKVIFPQEEGSDYTYSYEEILNEVTELKKSRDGWRERYYGIRYALRKDEVLDESISCTDILSDDEMMEDLKKRAADSDYYKEKSELLEEKLHKAETDVTILNSKVEVLKNKSDKYLNKIISQQTTHYKQCARILELENMVSKLQSGEYDDILAKDIEIKSLQAKYEDAMAGWKDTINTNDKLEEEIKELRAKNQEYFNEISDRLAKHTDQCDEIAKLKKEKEELKYWMKRCHKAETDVTTLNSKVEALKNKYNQLKEKYETECKSGSNIVEENVKLEKELEVALNKNTSLLTKVAERNRDIEKLRYEIETKKKEYRDTINALKSQKKYLEERMEIMKDDIKYLKQRYEEE